MEPDIRQMSEKFGSVEYQNITNIHPLAIAAVVILGILLVVVPRRWSIFPMLIIACFISSVQKISILEIDFDLLRIMVLFGVARLIIFRGYIDYEWIPLDTVMVLWTISSMVIYTLQQGTFSAFVNRLGFGFDAFGMYFLFRCLIKDWLDVDRIIMGFILISIPVAAFFVLEKGTGHNVFSVFGGVPSITIVREGKARCQGAFSHPIIAGCFWASLVPLLATYWWKSAKDRIWAIIGLITSLTIVVCSASSTPVMGVFAAIIGGLFFVFHRQMRVVRWTVLLLLVVLHMVMEAPVWHLISRISAVGGSTGYFRYQLIDNAIRHFGEWAILGTKSTAHWFWGAQDLCNQYILVGVEGGFLTLCFFIIVIAVAFREVGRLWRSQSLNPYRIALSWAMGVSLFVHCMNFIGVSYFGQIWLIWYLLLAMIGSLSVCRQTSSVPKIQSSPLMKKGRY